MQSMKLKHRFLLSVVIAAAFAAALVLGAPPEGVATALLIPPWPGLAEFWEKIRGTEAGKLAPTAQLLNLPFYDTVIYPTAGATSLTFFQSSLGAAGSLSAQPGNANNAKTIADTNMRGQGGQMSAQQAFFIQGIEVRFLAGSVNTANTFTPRKPTAFAATADATVGCGEDDIAAFYGAGSLSLTVGQASSPQYEAGPLMRFPPQQRMGLDAAVASNAAVGTGEIVKSIAYCMGEPCLLRPGLNISPSTAFTLTLNWPVAVATPSGFNGQVQVALLGWRFQANPTG